MKKIILLLALCLGFVAQAYAMDSTALSDPKILGMDIQQSTSVTPVGTVITWASDKMPNDGPGVWLECDGRAIPSDAKYQGLRDILMSNNTPNYDNQFLRGGTASQVGQVAADSTRSHAHAIDQHSHTVSGTSSGQLYSAPAASGNGGGYATFYHNSYSEPDSGTQERGVIPGYAESIPESDKNISMGGMTYAISGGGGDYDTRTYVSIGGSVSTTPAYTGGGSITGVANAAGPTSTHASGNAETAPQHIRVRYLIRALP